MPGSAPDIWAQSTILCSHQDSVTMAIMSPQTIAIGIFGSTQPVWDFIAVRTLNESSNGAKTFRKRAHGNICHINKSLVILAGAPLIIKTKSFQNLLHG